LRADGIFCLIRSVGLVHEVGVDGVFEWGQQPVDAVQ
jgi:hypothetical protein